MTIGIRLKPISNTSADLRSVTTDFKRLHKNTSGQILTSVIVFMAFGLSVIALSAVLTIINIQNTAKTTQSVQALNYAEAGAEEAILRLIRDPGYLVDGSSGSLPIVVSPDTITIYVDKVTDALLCPTVLTDASHDKRVITSTATYNQKFVSNVEAQVCIANGVVTLLSWKQIP